MSGICAFYAMNGEPCHRDLLTHMSRSLAARGDVTEVWSEGSVGLAMTVWQQDQTPHSETLPYFWQAGDYRLAADVRLSQREALLQVLQTHQMPLKRVSDVALIAAAYHLWGERCVEHLQGDFTFVVWDERRHRLFAVYVRYNQGIRQELIPLPGFLRDTGKICRSLARRSVP